MRKYCEIWGSQTMDNFFQSEDNTLQRLQQIVLCAPSVEWHTHAQTYEHIQIKLKGTKNKGSEEGAQEGIISLEPNLI
jgi:hypothetical protein